jgi:hypothetical protein
MKANLIIATCISYSVVSLTFLLFTAKADHSPPSSVEDKMCGAIPPLPYTPSWRGAQLKKSTGTYLSLLFTYIYIL